jgi:hypothetical protein
MKLYKCEYTYLHHIIHNAVEKLLVHKHPSTAIPFNAIYLGCRQQEQCSRHRLVRDAGKCSMTDWLETLDSVLLNRLVRDDGQCSMT